MNRVHFDVNSLLNVQTKTQIKNALDKVDGIQMVNVDINRSTVEVGYNKKADVNSIRNAIEHVGCKIE